MNYEEKLEQYLRTNKVPFQVQHHPLAYTAQRGVASEHISGKMKAKVVMVIADGDLVMLALPAPEIINVNDVAAALGAKEVRLAHEEESAGAFPDCEVGAMPPFGNLYSLPIYVDKTLAE
jgi:Ala-tRNA(Pro) deacylase